MIRHFIHIGILSLILINMPTINIHCKEVFGGNNISRELYEFILKVLPKNKTILELGSGAASGELSKHYKVYSIEHNKKWLNKYNTHYIYAPIVNGWYNTEILKDVLPTIKYDLILVDGPPGTIGRGKFYDYINLFNINVPIIFDDTHREAEINLVMKVSQKLNIEPKVFKCYDKKFSVLIK